MRFIKWYVDASSADNNNLNIRKGGIMMWVTGATQYGLMKKTLNTISTTEAEVIGVDDMASKFLRKKYLLRIKDTMLKGIFRINIT